MGCTVNEKRKTECKNKRQKVRAKEHKRMRWYISNFLPLQKGAELGPPHERAKAHFIPESKRQQQQQCGSSHHHVRRQPGTFEGLLAVYVVQGSSAHGDAGEQSAGRCFDDLTLSPTHPQRTAKREEKQMQTEVGMDKERSRKREGWEKWQTKQDTGDM